MPRMVALKNPAQWRRIKYSSYRVEVTCMAATLEAVRVGKQNLLLPEGPFRNEPFTDFSRPENARAMRAALDKVRAELGREYNLIIGGENIKTTGKIKSINPAHPSEVVGIHQRAEKEQVEPAMKAALAAFESWKFTSVEERVSVVMRTAQILRERKFEFNAWLVYEVGKNWAEADGDVAET